MHPLLADARASASLTRLLVPWSRNEHLQGLAPEAAAVQRYDPEIRTYTFSASVRLAAGTPRGARTMAGRWAWGHRSSGRGQHVDYGRARWRRGTFLQGASRARRQARWATISVRSSRAARPARGRWRSPPAQAIRARGASLVCVPAISLRPATGWRCCRALRLQWRVRQHAPRPLQPARAPARACGAERCARTPQTLQTRAAACAGPAGAMSRHLPAAATARRRGTRCRTL